MSHTTVSDEFIGGSATFITDAASSQHGESVDSGHWGHRVDAWLRSRRRSRNIPRWVYAMGGGNSFNTQRNGTICHDRITDAPAPVTAMPRIGGPAPVFTAVTTQGDISFPADCKGKWVVFFSHPADFTPVCTSEFMTFASMRQQFAAYNTELVGLSVDGLYSHIAWLRTIKDKITFRDMSEVEVTFPLIEDIAMKIAQKYGMNAGRRHDQSGARSFRHRPHRGDPGDDLLPAEPRPQLRRAPARRQGPTDSRPLRRRHAGGLAAR